MKKYFTAGSRHVGTITKTKNGNNTSVLLP
jgi:hypothetical protein